MVSIDEDELEERDAMVKDVNCEILVMRFSICGARMYFHFMIKYILQKLILQKTAFFLYGKSHHSKTLWMNFIICAFLCEELTK